MIPTLETERLTLRRPYASDQNGFMTFLMSPRAVYAGGTDDRKKAESGFAALRDSWSKRPLGLFTIERKSDGRAIGHVGGYLPDGWPEIELGWSLWRDEDEGQGYAQEAVIAARSYAFDVLGWETAVSYIAPDNRKSIALAGRLGAQLDDFAPKPQNVTCLVYRHLAALENDDDGSVEAYV